MRLVVTGREGQVARSLIEQARRYSDIEVAVVGRPDLDLEDAATIMRALETARPNAIISAAAYTAVDRAEDESALAFAINRDGAGHVAAAAVRLGVPVIHLSTDYVFDGEMNRGYTEEDPTGPRNVYGASKLAGEKAVMGANPNYLILRTSWVYSPFGSNFVRTMLRIARKNEEIPVVADQRGCPTSALDIADAILHVAGVMCARTDGFPWGTYHLAGAGETSWSDFARHILTTSRRLGGPYAHITDISAADYPTKARRPSNSCLSSRKFTAAFGWISPHWRQSTKEVVTRLICP